MFPATRNGLVSKNGPAHAQAYAVATPDLPLIVPICCATGCLAKQAPSMENVGRCWLSKERLQVFPKAVNERAVVTRPDGRQSGQVQTRSVESEVLC